MILLFSYDVEIIRNKVACVKYLLKADLEDTRAMSIDLLIVLLLLTWTSYPITGEKEKSEN